MIDIKGSSEFEQNADKVIFIRPLDGGLCWLTVAKDRFGPGGSFTIEFEKTTSVFKNDKQVEPSDYRFYCSPPSVSKFKIICLI